MVETGQKRRKGGQIQETLSDKAAELRDGLINSKAKVNGTIRDVNHKLEKEENIFLFIPNIIGLWK